MNAKKQEATILTSPVFAEYKRDVERRREVAKAERSGFLFGLVTGILIGAGLLAGIEKIIFTW